MAIFEVIANFASQNFVLFFIAVIICTAALGDATIVLLTVLAMHFKIPLIVVIIGSYIGSMTGDLLWFILGNKIIRIIETKRQKGNYKKVESITERLFKKNPLVLLCFVKFLYGTRVITTLYLSKKKMGLNRFFKYNFLALIPWILFMVGIGFLVGKGFVFISDVIKNIQLAIIILIVFILLFDLIQRRINKWIEIKNK